MNKVRRTKTPCHGCGKPEERPSGTLCQRCTERLALAENFLEGKSARPVYPYDDKIHYNPQLIAQYDRDDEGKCFDAVKKFAEALGLYAAQKLNTGYRTCVMLTDDVKPTDKRIAIGGRLHSGIYVSSYYLLTDSQQLEWQNLLNTIETAIQKAYSTGERCNKKALDSLEEAFQKGLEKGKNLLISLNTGSITMKDFEKEITEYK